MLKANERRQKILEILCVRRQETMENLAQEFNVTTRTIRSDIEELTLYGLVSWRTGWFSVCTPYVRGHRLCHRAYGSIRIEKGIQRGWF